MVVRHDEIGCFAETAYLEKDSEREGALFHLEDLDFVEHGFDILAHLDEVLVEDALAVVGGCPRYDEVEFEKLTAAFAIPIDVEIEASLPVGEDSFT